MLDRDLPPRAQTSRKPRQVRDPLRTEPGNGVGKLFALTYLIMAPRPLTLGWLATVLLASSLGFAEPAASVVRVGPAKAGAAVDARTRAAVRAVVKRHISQAQLDPALRAYTISPALVQLRRYVDADGSPPSLVCVIELALFDDQKKLIGSVRGSAKAVPADKREALNAAARAAVAELPQLLAALERSQSKARIVAAR
jgi:hypothetical protein